MNEPNIEKAFKNAKWFSIGLLVLLLLAFIFNAASGTFNILSLISILLLIFTAIGCNIKVKYGPICGIIVSILLILSRDLISLIFGIFFLIDCIKLLNYLKNS